MPTWFRRLVLAGCFLAAAGLGAEVAPATPTREVLRFHELWAYLMNGEEAYFNRSQTISDLAYFGAGLNSSGELIGVPKASALKGFAGRKHLVLAVVDNAALTHMALFPGFPVREALLTDLVKAAEDFDGIQLDFETISSRDKTFFWSFLADLRSRMGGKVLSIAIPARTKAGDDVFDYTILGGLADRIIIMAYDEHWSGSSPGSVASLDWCRRVAQYAQSTIDATKLVMGAPFYGRAWADKTLSRAYKHSGVTKIQTDKDLGPPSRVDGVPMFEYDEVVKVRVYYEDWESQFARLSQYAALGIRNTAFWRLGQEDPETWKSLALD